MDKMLLEIFQRQVLLQCTFLLFAAEDVAKGLEEKNSKFTFYALQNMLNAGANISKALWGAKDKHEKVRELRRKPLRDSIGISDDSPLRQVKMRNNFEHYDERLDTWWEKSTNHNYADLSIISASGGPVRPGSGLLADSDRFREFDPATTDLVFWGQKFHLDELVDEVTKIIPRLQAEVEK